MFFDGRSFVTIALCSFLGPLLHGQQSIADAVTQLQTDVANLQRIPPGAGAGANVTFAPKQISFHPGYASFENPNGNQVATVGSATEGAGGVWITDKAGKQVFSATSKAAGNQPWLELDNAGVQVVSLTALDNGSGISNFYSSAGKAQASFGGNVEGKGGAAWLDDANGNTIAYLGASTTGSPRLSLTRSDGTASVAIEDLPGGALTLYNRAGKAIARMGDDPSEGGAADFYNAAGDMIVAVGTNSANSSLGSVWTKGQDLAESFDRGRMGDEKTLIPGSVVAVTGDDGGIALSTGSYDPKVVGVLSGAGELHPAITLGKDRGGQVPPVAIAGQVYVRVTTEGGAIQVGDLLVSSSIPGVAMRASNNQQALGAIVGKALHTYRDGGEGLIRMLVLNR